MVGSDSEIVQFTQEQLEALLGEKFTENDPKKKLELMTEQNKMFKRCIKWHQHVVENRVLEKERLQSAMESSEQMRKDYELRCMRAEPQQGSDGLDQQVKAFTAQLVKLDEFNRTVRATLGSWELKAREMHSDSRSELEARERYVRELEDVLSNKESQLNEGEKLRKKLQNTILELKGNIRVFCRVRPLLGDDVVGTEAPVVFFPPSTEALGSGIDVIQNGNNYHFNFDEVFTGECSQQDCFEDTSELVQSALDGFKVCIFAYGQTGSGKTYTMMGRPDSSEHKGLIPRSLEQIFKGSQSLQAQGWKYKLQASMLEIYNETIRDLLSTNRSSGFDMSRAEKSVPAKRYAVKHDANGNAYVSDLSIVDVGSVEEISSLLQQAAQSRSVGRTQMNEQSSRSHFVFTLHISRVNESTGQQVQGVLNLIDLAGSERLSKSMATGDRLKETQAINKSLSSLADVISALAKKEDHIPFRNSKLTYLLQPYLGGDSKTLMFINISPEASCVGESLSSLRFATRVNACELGIPRIQSTVRPFTSPTSSRPFSHARRR